MSVISSNKELDSTLLILGGVILSLCVVIGLFYIHIRDGNDDLLSPEILMSIIQLPATLVAYGIGKRSGEKNGNDTLTHTERYKMRQEILDELESEIENGKV